MNHVILWPGTVAIRLERGFSFENNFGSKEKPMRKKLQTDVATRGKFDSIWEKVQRSKLFDRLDTKDRAFLKSLLFGDFCWPYIPLCNMYVEVAARQVMQQLSADWVTKHPERKRGAKRVRMITMLFADQFVDFDQPEMCLDKVKGRIRRLLKALGLHGFVFIEMQPTILPVAVALMNNDGKCHGRINVQYFQRMFASLVGQW